MKEIEYGYISFEHNSILIEKTNVPEKSNAKNIKVTFDKDHNWYSVTATIQKKIYVCSQEEYEKTDVFLCEVEEDQELDEELISLVQSEILNEIEYSLKDFYIDHRKNQYTGDRNFYLFLRKGQYKSKTDATVEYISNNISIR